MRRQRVPVVASALLLGLTTMGFSSLHQPIAKFRHITLTMWLPGSGTYPYNILTKDFEKTHPGVSVKINLVSNSENYIKYTSALTAGNGPNIIMTYGYQPVLSWAADHLIAPLSPYIKKDHLRLPPYWPVVKQALTHRGVYYGLPVEVDEPMLLYNKTMFKKAGLNPNNPPKTIAQLTADAKKLTIFKNGHLVQAGLVPADRWGLNIWARYFGGSWFNPKTGKFVANQSANVAAFVWLKSMYKMLGGVAQASSFETQNKVGNAFLAGQEAMEIGGEWVPGEATPNRKLLINTSTWLTHKVNTVPILNYGVAPVPVGPGIKPGSVTLVSPGNSFVMSRNASHPNTTAALIAYLAGPYATNYYNITTLDLPAFPHGSVVNSVFWKKAPAERPWLSEFDRAGATAKPVSATPVNPYFVTQRSNYEQRIIRGAVSPKQGLQELNTMVNQYQSQFNATHPGW